MIVLFIINEDLLVFEWPGVKSVDRLSVVKPTKAAWPL